MMESSGCGLIYVLKIVAVWDHDRILSGSRTMTQSLQRKCPRLEFPQKLSYFRVKQPKAHEIFLHTAQPIEGLAFPSFQGYTQKSHQEG